MTRITPHRWPNRVGIFHRPNGKRPWRLLLHVGTPELARRLVVDLAATGERGDYTTAPADRPPTRFR